MKMTQKAKEARAAYLRAWHAQHPEKRKQYSARYWNRKAKKLSESVATTTGTDIINLNEEEKKHEKQN